MVGLCGLTKITRKKTFLIYLLVKINTVQEKIEKEKRFIYSLVQQIFSNTHWPKDRDSKGFVCVWRDKVIITRCIFITISAWQTMF